MALIGFCLCVAEALYQLLYIGVSLYVCNFCRSQELLLPHFHDRRASCIPFSVTEQMDLESNRSMVPRPSWPVHVFHRTSECHSSFPFQDCLDSKRAFQIICDTVQRNVVLFVIQVCHLDHLSYLLYGIRHHYITDISAQQDTIRITSPKSAEGSIFQQFESDCLWSQFSLETWNSPYGNFPWLGTPAIDGLGFIIHFLFDSVWHCIARPLPTWLHIATVRDLYSVLLQRNFNMPIFMFIVSWLASLHIYLFTWDLPHAMHIWFQFAFC